MVEKKTSIFQKIGLAVDKTIRGTLVEGSVDLVLKEDDHFWQVIVRTKDEQVVTVRLANKGVYFIPANPLAENLSNVPTISRLRMPYNRGDSLSLRTRSVIKPTISSPHQKS